MTITQSQLPKISFPLRQLGKTILKLSGWKTIINVPLEPKSVFVFAPHTSNFDFIFMMSAIYSAGIKITWIGKKELFKGMAGPFFRWLGGVPIDRSSGVSTIKGLIREIRKSDNIFLGISPEGTRAYTETWKSGFYFLAKKTKTPISLGYLDYEKKIVGVDPGFSYELSKEEMEVKLRAYYKDIKGGHPDNFGPIVID